MIDIPPDRQDIATLHLRLAELINVANRVGYSRISRLSGELAAALESVEEAFIEVGKG